MDTFFEIDSVKKSVVHIWIFYLYVLFFYFILAVLILFMEKMEITLQL